jgi:hypothetical protein
LLNKNLKGEIIMKTLFIFLFCFLSIHAVCYSQWVQTAGTPQGGGITDMLVTPNGTLIVTCASFNFPNGQSGGIRHSTNNGTTWENDYQHYTARTLAMGQNGYVFASSWDYPNISEGLWVSFNQGAVWQGHLYLIGSNNNIFSILVRDNNQTIYIGTRTGVRKSTNGGGSFNPVNNGIPANSWVRDLAAKTDGSIYAATTNGVFRSTNTGSSWQQFSGVTPGDTVVKLCIYDLGADGNNQTLIGGTNNGKAYEEGAELFLASFFVANNTNEFSGMDALGVALFMTQFNESGDPGACFTMFKDAVWVHEEHNEGLTGSRPISVVAVNPVIRTDNTSTADVYLGYYEGTGTGAKVFKRTFPIGILQISSEIPKEFSLSQNYPNPFNPMTKIKFSVPNSSNVNITVFDVLGRHITTLVNEKLNAGTYETEWNANSMPGGVYFYRIETEDFSETKKMILVK